MTNLSFIVAGFAVIALAGVMVAVLAKFTWPMFRAMGIGFALVAAGFLHSMATKPTITWDDYLADNGSHFTNANSQVVFKWSKTNAALPNTQPLFVSRKLQNSTDAWQLMLTSTVGAWEVWSAALVGLTNYEYYVWHEWSPPSPVHTNGVWLGTVIEKARGSSGVDKLLIINGKLERDGKIIAPPER